MFRSKSYRTSKSHLGGGGSPDKKEKPFFTPQPVRSDSKASPGATAPALTAKPSYLTNDGCSDLKFGINWELSKNSSPKGGFILQEITIMALVFDCHNRPLPMKKKMPLHYFEAWRVEPNSTDVTPENADTFFFNIETRDHTAHTYGSVVWTAAATYHDNVSEAEMPDHMVRNNPNTAAGVLLSSVHDPRLGGNASPPIPHELSYHWSCCTSGMSPNVIDSKTPS
jgi:hypothetical protein